MLTLHRVAQRAKLAGGAANRHLHAAASAAPAASTSASMRWAVGGWSFFIAENVILSENRDMLKDVLSPMDKEEGDSRYHLLYGTISTLAMASTGFAYFKRVRGAAPLQWHPTSAPPALRVGLSFALQGLGLAMFVQAFPKLQMPVGAAKTEADAPQPNAAASPPRAWAVRCPFDFTDGRRRAESTEVAYGVERVSRHSGLWSFGLVCLGEALVVPSVPQAAWLAMPLLVAFIGGAHTDSRYARGMGGELPPERAHATSNVPFLAMALGRQGEGALLKLVDEGKTLNAALAIVAAAMLALRRGR